MYCILVTGIPASGKSTLAEYLSKRLGLPVISKDRLKEVLFDCLGFRSREEKVKLGCAAVRILYETAESLMKVSMPFILENNFERSSAGGLEKILNRYGYTPVTLLLTGDYGAIYRRFAERNFSPERHRGHVVNDCYPEPEEGAKVLTPSYEDFVSGIEKRGMDQLWAKGPCLKIDTTDFARIDWEKILERVAAVTEGLR